MNVLLVVLDAVRAGHLGCYGYQRPTSPNIDRLAYEGTLFEQAISPAVWTLPSFASLFTGLFPSQHGTYRRHPLLDGLYMTLAEFMAAAGYETVMVAGNSWISDETGFARGFHHFFKTWQLFQKGRDIANQVMTAEFSYDVRVRTRLREILLRDNPIANLANASYGRYFYKRTDYGARKANRLAARWLEQRDRSRPFFLCVHYLDPHLRYEPPAPFRHEFLKRTGRRRAPGAVNQDAWAFVCGQVEMDEEDFAILTALYDAEIAYTDYRLGQLLDRLDVQGLLANTLVIVTADHGENLGEHGLLDHQYCVYDTLLHVPLVMRLPGRLPAGQRVRTQVQTSDIFPTLVDLIGARDRAPLEQLQGHSTLSTSAQEGAQEREAFAEYLDPQPRVERLEERYPGFRGDHLRRSLKCIRTGQHKYIWASDENNELYDLNRDPGETCNLVAERPRLAAQLQSKIRTRLGEPVFEGQSEREYSWAEQQAVKKRLEDLGYL